MDAAGRPLGPLVTWADGRAGAAVRGHRRRRASQGTAGPHRDAGAPDVAADQARLVARRTTRQTLRDTPRWGGVKELVLAELADAPFQVDLSLASGTGLYDIHRRRWDPEALEIAGVRAGPTRRGRAHHRAAAAALRGRGRRPACRPTRR